VQRVQAMDVVVRGTPARWWAMHKEDAGGSRLKNALR